MRKTRSGADVIADYHDQLTHRQALVEQIKRDVEAAREADEEWWKTFFSLRAASYRILLAQHDLEAK